MRSLRALGILVLLSALLPGCWLQPRYSATRGGWNPDERILTSTNAADLVELWQAQVASGVNAPIAVGHSLFVTTTSGVATRLAAASGDVQWRQDLSDGATEGLSLGAPVWHGNQIVIPWSFFRFGNVFRLAPATGAVVGGGDVTNAFFADASVADDVVAVINGSFAPGIGVAHVSWTTRATIFTGGMPRISSYAIVGDHVLWGSDGTALGYGPVCQPFPAPVPQDWCAPHWTTGLSATIVGGPAGNGPEQVVYADGSGTVSVLDVATGALRWTASLGAGAAAAPAVAGGTILVPTVDGRLVSLPAPGCGAATCEALWEAELGSPASQPPAVGGDVAYVGTQTGDLVAVALGGCAATCDPLVTLSTGSAISGGPIVHDGRLIAGTADGRVVAFGLPN